MELVFIDIDNTLLDFDEYIRRTMQEGFAHFGLKPVSYTHLDVYKRQIQECIQNSTFKSSYGAPTGNILTLSTCDYDFDNARYVVMGELVPVKNPAESAE